MLCEQDTLFTVGPAGQVQEEIMRLSDLVVEGTKGTGTLWMKPGRLGRLRAYPQLYHALRRIPWHSGLACMPRREIFRLMLWGVGIGSRGNR